jgi:glycosyltransferase involved in cell wall biosynthesis
MPCYNAALFVGAAIQSVLDQTYTDWELVIVDDCSVDGSREVIEGYAAQYDNVKAIFLSEKLGSAGPVRNRAIAEARGRYLAFLDADDAWFPNKLEEHLSYMSGKNSAFSASYTRLVDGSMRLVGEYRPKQDVAQFSDMLKENYVSTSSAVVDTHAVKNIVFPDILRCQDYACWMSILSDGVDVHIMPKVLTYYRVDRKQSVILKPRNVYYRWIVHYKLLNRGFIKSVADIAVYAVLGASKTFKTMFFR